MPAMRALSLRTHVGIVRRLEQKHRRRPARAQLSFAARRCVRVRQKAAVRGKRPDAQRAARHARRIARHARADFRAHAVAEYIHVAAQRHTQRVAHAAERVPEKAHLIILSEQRIRRIRWVERRLHRDDASAQRGLKARNSRGACTRTHDCAQRHTDGVTPLAGKHVASGAKLTKPSAAARASAALSFRNCSACWMAPCSASDTGRLRGGAAA
jgi:hypothetical protein